MTFRAIATLTALVVIAAPAAASSERLETIPERHTVKRGETLSKIAHDWVGGWTRAAVTNDLADPNVLHIGQVLIEPSHDGPRWKPRPAPAASRSADSESGESAATGSVWDQLAECEASGDWGADTGNGYTGGLQFSGSTHRAYGGDGYAADDSREEQIAVAERVQAAQGWDAWPSCSEKLGLR